MNTIFLKILDMSFMASWLMIAVMLLRLLLKKAPKWIVCMLWILVGVRLICPFSVESAWSLIPSSEPVSELIRSGLDSSGSDMSESGIPGGDMFGTDIFTPDMPEGNRVETDMSEGSTSDMDRFQVNPADMNETGTITPAADAPEIDAAESVNPEHMSIGRADGYADSSAGYQADDSDGYPSGNHDDITTPVTPLDSIISILDMAWITGVALMLLYGFVSYYRLHKITAASMEINIETDADANTDKGKKVFQCDAIDTPFILGIIRPRIYLPSHMEDSWTDYVIAHEKAHIRRRDHWWKPMGFLILSVYWFNPLCWLSYILLCRDIELACDEAVIKAMDTDSKKIYAKALLSCSVKQKMITACPLAFGEVGIKERIRGVMNYKKPAFWIVAVSLIACIVVAVCFLTEPKMTVDMEDSESQITDASGENEETDKNEEVDTSHEIAETDADNFEYSYNKNFGGIIISRYIGDDTSVTIPEMIEGNPVVQIATLAFYGCDSLTNIEIPNSVKFIGDNAFKGCDNLTDVTISGGLIQGHVNHFYGCESLANITILDGITSIRNNAFWNCSNLISITIPDSVITIGIHAFENCSNLTSVTIPDSVIFIDAMAFYNCENLTNITIPENINFIGTRAFSGCSRLTNIEIPDSVHFIGNNAFEGCDALTVIYNGQAYDDSNNDSLRFEDIYAQYESSDFRYIYDTEREVWGIETYYGDRNTSSIIIPSEIHDNPITYIGDFGLFNLGLAATDITISEGIQYIGEFTFSEEYWVERIVLPNSLEYIGALAFSECISLTDITIPDNVTYIGKGAFSGCRQLTGLSIPDSVTTIEPYAFNRCDNLTVTYRGRDYKSSEFEELYALFN